MFDIPMPYNQSMHFYQVSMPLVQNNFILASIVKIPPKQDLSIPYSKLRCTETDRAKITELITCMGTMGKLTLLTKKKHLTRIGDDVRPVHPFQFLGVIYTNPNLKNYMLEILDDFFKRTNFLEGLGGRLDAELIKGSVDRYLEDFCMQVNAAPDEVKAYIISKDYKGLLTYLCQL